MADGLDWRWLLPVGARHCPRDKGEALHFEVLGGMRMRHQAGRGHVYRSLCPTCRRHFNVLAPNEETP